MYSEGRCKASTLDVNNEFFAQVGQCIKNYMGA